jgi:hypothetical protein
MVSASSLAHFNSTSPDNSLETVEIDPQYAEGLGFKKGDVVSSCFPLRLLSLIYSRSKWDCSMTYQKPSPWPRNHSLQMTGKYWCVFML